MAERLSGEGDKTEVIQEQHYVRQLSFDKLCLDIYPVGADIAAVLYGGSRPHIGCAVLCVPRESLTGDGTVSCTSSVLNVTGHKDEDLCRKVGEELCRKYNAVVNCSGGFHKDDISMDEIEEVLCAVRDLLDQI